MRAIYKGRTFPVCVGGFGLVMDTTDVLLDYAMKEGRVYVEFDEDLGKDFTFPSEVYTREGLMSW